MSGEVLWTAEAAAQATGGRLEGRTDWCANGVSIDSRNLARGDLFVALTGLNRDGHQFAPSAVKAGASACMVSEPAPGLTRDACLLHVDDTLSALNSLAQAARARSAATRIAITGSVGKTSTKEMLRHVLGRQRKTHASAASYNNMWGVPLTLARMPQDAEFGVFEIGMNHAGEITPLSRLVAPQVAVITTVAPVHLEFFSGVEAIADAKAEIFDGMGGDGVAVLNADSEHFTRLRAAAQGKGCSIISFGAEQGAEARVMSVDARGDESDVTADICGVKVRYVVPVPGRHWVMNSVAALAAVHAAGADAVQAAEDLSTISAPKGRGRQRRVQSVIGEFVLIDESYNANPASMGAAIATLGARRLGEQGRRVAILGDMLELGATAPQLHAALAASLGQAEIDRIYLVGPLMKHLWEAAPNSMRGAWTATSQEMASLLGQEIASGTALREGDAVMVKGSLGSRMAPLVEMLEALDVRDYKSEKSG